METVKAGYQILGSSLAVNTAGTPITLFALNILSDSTAGTVSLYNGTAATGSPAIVLNGTVSKGIVNKFPNGMVFPAGCYVSLDDAHTTSVTAIYTRP